MTETSVLISVHSQEGYSHGFMEEEYREFLDDYKNYKILLKDEDKGKPIGGEDSYDLIIDNLESYGQLDQDIADTISRLYGRVDIAGFYGSECVSNLVDVLEPSNIRVLSEYTFEQSFGRDEPNFDVHDAILEGGERAFRVLEQKFRDKTVLENFEVAGSGQTLEEFAKMLDNRPESDPESVTGFDARANLRNPI